MFCFITCYTVILSILSIKTFQNRIEINIVKEKRDREIRERKSVREYESGGEKNRERVVIERDWGREIEVWKRKGEKHCQWRG